MYSAISPLYEAFLLQDCYNKDFVVVVFYTTFVSSKGNKAFVKLRNKMKNSELQTLLSSYPADMDVKYLLENREIVDYSGETLLISSETAYVDDEAPEEDWNTEDGQIKLADGKQFLLLNCIIV